MANPIAHKFKETDRTGDVIINEDVNFESLLLSDNVLNGLKNAGFERPSPIQLKAIPLGRCGLDLIVQAKSGTGKTCVFSVILLENVQTEAPTLQVLVLAPTREIAIQIWDVIKSIGSAMPSLVCHTFIGGMPLAEDKQKLKKCHIAVGTPGRIKQLIETNIMQTDSIRIFILDEADKLLEENFQDQINWIYSCLPDNKQMLALSATYPEYLAQHLTSYMRNPTFLRLNISDPALLGIKQFKKIVAFHPLPNKVFEYKMKAVVELLSSVNFQQCLMFSNLQTRAQNMSDVLHSKGWPTACIAGSLDQKDRNEAMAKLKSYQCRVLISTDLTARGIDADKVNLVINLDVPKHHETYLHRIGRAGRFGSFGAAVTIMCVGQEEMDLHKIEKKCNTSIKELPDPIPSTLTKSVGIIRLDDVVSTERINTDDVKFSSDKLVPTKEITTNSYDLSIKHSYHIQCEKNGTGREFDHNSRECEKLKEDVKLRPEAITLLKESVKSLGEMNEKKSIKMNDIPLDYESIIDERKVQASSSVSDNATLLDRMITNQNNTKVNAENDSVMCTGIQSKQCEKVTNPKDCEYKCLNSGKYYSKKEGNGRESEENLSDSSEINVGDHNLTIDTKKSCVNYVRRNVDNGALTEHPIVLSTVDSVKCTLPTTDSQVCTEANKLLTLQQNGTKTGGLLDTASSCSVIQTSHGKENNLEDQRQIRPDKKKKSKLASVEEMSTRKIAKAKRRSRPSVETDIHVETRRLHEGVDGNSTDNRKLIMNSDISQSDVDKTDVDFSKNSLGREICNSETGMKSFSYEGHESQMIKEERERVSLGNTNNIKGMILKKADQYVLKDKNTEDMHSLKVNTAELLKQRETCFKFQPLEKMIAFQENTNLLDSVSLQCDSDHVVTEKTELSRLLIKASSLVIDKREIENSLKYIRNFMSVSHEGTFNLQNQTLNVSVGVQTEPPLAEWKKSFESAKTDFNRDVGDGKGVGNAHESLECASVPSTREDTQTNCILLDTKSEDEINKVSTRAFATPFTIEKKLNFGSTSAPNTKENHSSKSNTQNMNSNYETVSGKNMIKHTNSDRKTKKDDKYDTLSERKTKTDVCHHTTNIIDKCNDSESLTEEETSSVGDSSSSEKKPEKLGASCRPCGLKHGTKQRNKEHRTYNSGQGYESHQLESRSNDCVDHAHTKYERSDNFFSHLYNRDRTSSGQLYNKFPTHPYNEGHQFYHCVQPALTRKESGRYNDRIHQENRAKSNKKKRDQNIYSPSFAYPMIPNFQYPIPYHLWNTDYSVPYGVPMYSSYTLPSFYQSPQVWSHLHKAKEAQQQYLSEMLCHE